MGVMNQIVLRTLSHREGALASHSNLPQCSSKTFSRMDINKTHQSVT